MNAKLNDEDFYGFKIRRGDPPKILHDREMIVISTEPGNGIYAVLSDSGWFAHRENPEKSAGPLPTVKAAFAAVGEDVDLYRRPLYRGPDETIRFRSRESFWRIVRIATGFTIGFVLVQLIVWARR